MTSASRLSVVAGWLCLALLAPRGARADDNHYQNFLVGERATGLGGAFTALSNDSSGAYYNPAGLAEVAHSSVSLSSAVYGFASESYTIGEVGFESSNRSFVSYPTTAAWIQLVRRGAEDGRGRVQLALSIVTPQSDVLRRRIAYSGDADPAPSGDPRKAHILQVEASEDEVLWFGFSGAWKIHRRLSVGATLYGTRRTGIYQVNENGIVQTFDPVTQDETGRVALAQRTDVDFTHYGLLGILGVAVALTSELKLGAAFRTPSLALSGKGDISVIGTALEPETGQYLMETVSIRGATFRDRQPFKATLGAAYSVPSRWAVSVDLSIYGPVGEYAIFEDSSEPSLATDLRMKKRLVWQLNAGGEYYILGLFPLRLGFFTNRSSYASFDTCKSSGACGEHDNVLTDRLDMYGVAGSVGWEVEKATLTVGASYSFGSRSDPVGPQLELDSRRSFLFIALGGSFRF